MLRLGFFLLDFPGGWKVLHRNGYAVSAKATSYLIVYSCVVSSFACMSFVHYLHNSKNKKRGDRSYFAYASTRSRAVIMPTNLSSLTIGNRLMCFNAIEAAAL